jgi:site-specific DNA recombinase
VPTAKLDQAVTQAVRDKLLTPERLTTILEALVDRQAAKDVAVANRRAAVEAEIKDTGDKLARLYRANEEGVVEIDAQLKERIAALKSSRDLAQDSLERIATQAASSRALTPERIAAFIDLVR